jgi:hypothetical protein
LRIEGRGCTIHLGRGAFVGLGYHTVGVVENKPHPPAKVTAISEPSAIGGRAVGVGCLHPGPDAIAAYSGHLLFSGSRGGVAVPFKVIL